MSQTVHFCRTEAEGAHCQNQSIALSASASSAPAEFMKVERIAEDHRVFVTDAPGPTVADDEVGVRPCACGICGTDLDRGGDAVAIWLTAIADARSALNRDGCRRVVSEND